MLCLRQPAQDRSRDELRAVVRSQVPRRTVNADELRRALRSRGRIGCCRPHRSPDTPGCTHRSPSGTSAAGRWHRHRTRSRMPRPGSLLWCRQWPRADVLATRRRGRFLGTCRPAAATVDAHDPRSSHARDAPGTPGCADSRSADTAPRARASPRAPAHRASPAATRTAMSTSPPTSARTLVESTARVAHTYATCATTHGRAHHFFAATSFITSISRSRSATSFLSFAFSCSSCRSRFTSTASSCPKLLAPR